MIYSLPKPLKLIVMGLWGIDMQVTDKMIKAALEAWFCEPVTEPYDEHVDNMRFAIQAAIQAAWVEFDKEKPSTHPPQGVSVLGLLSDGTMVTIRASVILKQDKRTPNGYESLHTTHWMPLPEFKEVHNE
jgi:hypothetical protein